MPAYPCSQCSKQVDVRDFQCKSCGEKKPFKCTKCGTTLGALEVFDPDKLTFQKPIFCTRCGRESERIPCHHCRNELPRYEAVERKSPAGDLVAYHAACAKTAALQYKVSYIMMFILIPFGLYAGTSLGYYTQMPWMAYVGAPIGAFFGWQIALLLGPRK